MMVLVKCSAVRKCTKPRREVRLKSEELRHLRYLVQRLSERPPKHQLPDEPDGYHYQ